MRLVIFDSTGETGRQLLEQALDQGHAVTAHVRSPEKLGGLEHANLSVSRMDVLDAGGVAGVVTGQDAVLCAIGAGPERTTLREDGARNIVAAMESTGVSRLLCLSSLGELTVPDGMSRPVS